MGIEVLTTEESKRKKIYTVIRALSDLEKTKVTYEDKYATININHELKFVPDFQLVWCPVMKYYRVYISVGAYAEDKKKACYSICTVNSLLVAIGFVSMYQFIHRNRSNKYNKEPL